MREALNEMNETEFTCKQIHYQIMTNYKL